MEQREVKKEMRKWKEVRRWRKEGTESLTGERLDVLSEEEEEVASVEGNEMEESKRVLR